MNATSRVKEQNITYKNFYISKAEVEILSNERKENILCTVKHVYPGKYLISIKNRAGIEAARIFVSNDTLLINDRINRKIYYGENKILEKKYGISYVLIPVLLGDLINNDLAEKNKEECIKGLIRTNYFIEGFRIQYVVDCKIYKAIYAYVMEENNEIEFKFSKYFKKGNLLFPGLIEVDDKNSMVHIIINVKKVDFPWEGSIDFIPGAKYEFIPIL
jgi:hypothetical protein